jgi:hypothetical protein
MEEARYRRVRATSIVVTPRDLDCSREGAGGRLYVLIYSGHGNVHLHLPLVSVILHGVRAICVPLFSIPSHLPSDRRSVNLLNSGQLFSRFVCAFLLSISLLNGGVIAARDALEYKKITQRSLHLSSIVLASRTRKGTATYGLLTTHIVAFFARSPKKEITLQATCQAGAITGRVRSTMRRSQANKE